MTANIFLAVLESLRFHPGSLHWLHLSWIALALFLVHLWSFHRKREALRAFAGVEVLRHLTPSVSWGRQYAKCAVVIAGILAVAIGIARPQWGSDVQEIRRKGIDLVVLLDLSKSMLAEDMLPNRLEWAKADLGELVGAFSDDRIGLVAFAGRAEIRCPLTFDYGFFRRILGELRVGSVALGGTAVGDAIRKGLDCYQDTVKNHKAILIITDGEDHESFVREAAEGAEARGVRIFSIGLGQGGDGARIPITDASGNKVFLKDKEGKEVWTKMDPRVLLEAAQITDGGYAEANVRKEGGEVAGVRDIYAKILDKVSKKDLEAAKEERFHDRYQWFLALGFILFSVEPFIRTRRREAAAPGGPGDSSSGPARSGPPRRAAGAALSKALPLALGLAAALGAGLGAPSPLHAGEYASLIHEGNRLYAEGKYAEAEEKYIQAGTERQDAPEVPYNIANTYFQREDFSKAIERYGEALKAVRDRVLEVSIRYNLGCARARESEKYVVDLGNSENLQKGVDLLREAIGGFRDVLEMNPSHAGARKNLAVSQLRVKSLLDQLKRLREEAEKKAREENKDKKDPAEVLRELIAEEKAEIDLTAGARSAGAAAEKLRAQRDRVLNFGEAVKEAAASEEAAKGKSADDAALRTAIESLDGLLADPEFKEGGAEASEAGKLARARDLTGAAKKVEEAAGRVLKEIGAKGEEAAKAIEKDRTDQTATMSKAMGLVMGLRNAAEGKDGAPTAPGGAAPPGPQPAQPPVPPEVKEVLLSIAKLAEEAGGKMAAALAALGATGGESPPAPAAPPDLPRAEGSQKESLDLLEKALAETEKLPKQEPPEPKKDEGEKKDGEKKDQGQKDEKKGGEKKESGKDEKKDEKKMSKEEAEQALRKFLEKDEERQRDRDRRNAARIQARGALEKDW
jgi:Ca-activated chloride channel family protein